MQYLTHRKFQIRCENKRGIEEKWKFGKDNP
jgi:hypothetical protein